MTKNIYILPTDKPSILIKDIWKNTFSLVENFNTNHINFKAHHIYITSNKEFKSSQDWFLDIKDNRNHLHQIGYDLEDDGWTEQYNPIWFKKIILTTDQDLIKDGVQAIDDEFLEWFVKNPSCEKVEIEESTLLNTSRTYLYIDKYKIIIPKEEYCSCTDECLGYLTKTCKGIKKELKQETLEEVNWKVLGTKTDTFYNGAKWQQERSYSEEELCLLNKMFELYWYENNNEHKDNLEEWELSKKLFEQFKKK